jgi:toxin ParE1/3/4
LARYRQSKLAEKDLEAIIDYTTDRWGEAQAVRYIKDLRDRFQQIADTPLLGRACHRIRPGYRRIEQGSHVIFYRQDAGSIVVSRVLHQRMLPRRHIIE